MPKLPASRNTTPSGSPPRKTTPSAQKSAAPPHKTRCRRSVSIPKPPAAHRWTPALFNPLPACAPAATTPKPSARAATPPPKPNLTRKTGSSAFIARSTSRPTAWAACPKPTAAPCGQISANKRGCCPKLASACATGCATTATTTMAERNTADTRSATIFNAGLEWWGIWCLTIHHPRRQTVAALAASATD